MSKPHLSARLELDALDERLVPSAVTIDLTRRGATAGAGAGIVAQTDTQPTGTGYIRSFVRVQGAASGGGSEQGYNTDARPLQFDENKSPQFTRSLGANLVPTVTVGGVKYREFLLDINQKSSASKLSIDDIRIFLGNSPTMTATAAEASSGVHTFAGLTPVFDLDAGGDRTILLDAGLNSGSGSGDMRLLVPDAAFVGGSYVYLYSKMGATAGATANGGFEEWAVKATIPPTVPPPPAPSSLSGFVYADLNNNGVFESSEFGISGVMIELRVTDTNGVTTTLPSATTDGTGAYSFTNLLPGTYTIIEHGPSTLGFIDGIDTVGTINGVTTGSLPPGTNDQMVLYIGPGQNAVNYNFGEQLVG